MDTLLLLTLFVVAIFPEVKVELITKNQGAY